MDRSVIEQIACQAVDDIQRSRINEIKNYGLLAGKTGLALYHFYLSRYLQREESLVLAGAQIETIFDIINNQSNHFAYTTSYSDGLAGFGFLLHVLSDEGVVEPDLVMDYKVTDDLFFSAAGRYLQDDMLDLLHGLFGILYYMAHSPMTPGTEQFLQDTVLRLEQKLIVDEKGSRFQNKAGFLNPDEINFSLSHGNTGFWLVLLTIYEKGIYCDKIRDMVTSGIDYLLHYANDGASTEAGYSLFPYGVNESAETPSHTPQPVWGNRLAWCYGDLNIALLLFRAGRLFQRPDYIHQADEIGRLAARRRLPAETEVYDSHFCHGSSGLAQYFSRLHDIGGGDCYADAYEYWIEQPALHLRAESKRTIVEEKYGILEGRLGSVLSLLYYLYRPAGAAWDSIFLLS